MLIILGGFLGTGRKSLARAFSERYGYHYYDMDQKRFRVYARMRDGTVRERLQRPHTDNARMHLCRRVLEDFPLLSKIYPDTVMSNAFHREKPRGYFLTQASQYSNPVIFMWIESSESLVSKRLADMKERGMIASIWGAKRRREKMRAEFEPFEQKPFIFEHGESDAASADRLWELVNASRP